MNLKGLSGIDLDSLSEEWDDDEPESKDASTPLQKWNKGWRPRLNKAQNESYESTAIFNLLHGPRASGKTLGGIHALVKHCFLNKNALAIILTKETGQQSDGGAWHKLEHVVLPIWQKGNPKVVDGQMTDALWDRGIGLDYTPSKNRQESKRPFLWIQNRFGGYSMVISLSLPVEGHVMSKVKGKEPSFILIDEAQTLSSDAYFKHLVQQLGRRPHITTVQQAYYCCNPEGPSHWLYKLFWEKAIDPFTGEMNPKFAKFHIPIQENKMNIPPDYWDNVMEAVKGDPIEEARMLRGEWIDRATGEGIYKESYIPSIHVRGDAMFGKGINPLPGQVCILGYDLGQTWNAITFLQIWPIKDMLVWAVFDGIYHFDKKIPYHALTIQILEKMDKWSKKVGKPLKYLHVTDDSATTQFRPNTGSYDAADIQRFSKERIKMMASPKGNESVDARLQMLFTKLAMEEVVISDTCKDAKEMFMNLEYDKAKPGDKLKLRRNKHLHVFDSLTYPMFKYQVAGVHGLSFHMQENRPEVYTCGSVG